MITLSTLSNKSRPFDKVQRVGRGMGSKRGKTCGRGTKGAKARAGYKKRYGHEGGQKPLYKKLPTRGFVNGRFKSTVLAINLSLINTLFNDQETVNYSSLRSKGYAPRRVPGGIKLLGKGEITKKLSFEVQNCSQEARSKIEAKGLSLKLVSLNSSV